MSSPSQAAPLPCPAASVWVNSPVANTGDRIGQGDLERRAPDGMLLDRVTITRTYQDIAWNASGTTLYAVASSVNTGPWLYELDPETGVELSEVAITGASSVSISSLTGAADGSLLLGNAGNRDIHKVDPATGVATLFAQFPAGVRSAGEFPQLPDGDILAVGQPTLGSTATFYRLKADGAMVPAGTVVTQAPVFSTTISGGDVFFSTRSHGLRRLDGDLPAGPSTAALSSTEVVAPVTSGHNYFGAASVQEAGACSVDADQSYSVAKAASAAGPVDEGGKVTYTVTVENTGARDYGDGLAGFEDDLSKVTDDAAVDADSIEASTGTATLNGDTLSWVGPLPAEGEGSTVTVTYDVVVEAPSDGDLSLVNSVTATGAGGACASEGGCTTTTAVNAAPVDSDGDGLTDEEEDELGTDPADEDSDDDGLSDGAEVNTHGTDPKDKDSDDDGLTDKAEIDGPAQCTNAAGTNPLVADTDGDRLLDGREVKGTSIKQSYYNNRGVPRNAKQIGLVRTNPCAKDSDRDGLTDWREITGSTINATMVRSKRNNGPYYVKVRKTNPMRADTDRDGLTDRQEVTGSANKRHRNRKTDPTRGDSDWGGVLDGAEVKNRTDPSRIG